jgi:hypothetical protein
LAAISFFGASTADRIMSVGDRLILEVFGERPTLDLASLQGFPTIPLKWYAVNDMSRSVVQRRKTVLDYVYTHPAVQGFLWDPAQAGDNKPDGSHDNVRLSRVG